MLVSVVVPTHNEEADIARTLDSLLALRYPHKEIIVVDNSTDATWSILESYRESGVQAYRQPLPDGRCGARNYGILKARGEVVVVLNADVLVPPDFVDRIVPHYEAGADYVLVGLRVANDQHMLPRFLGAQADYTYKSDDSVEWTEGFSCRRSALLAMGMFPTSFPIPMDAGEDGALGMKLARSGYRKKIDRSIVVQAVMPHTLRHYWAQQIGRGKGITQSAYFIDGRPLGRLLVERIGKTILASILRSILVWPIVCTSMRYCRYSRRGWVDLVPFCWAYVVQIAAQTCGKWLALWEIWYTSGHA